MKPRKLVYGVGRNNANYAVVKYGISEVNGVRKRRQVWGCPYYRVWANMLMRCHSVKWQERRPTYKGCVVSNEWLTFTNFKSWMEMQEWEGMHLDKDLLFEGNKVYSANTCMFVTPMVNTFASDCRASRGEWLIGACWSKGKGKFQSSCNNPFTKKYEYLGYFDTEQQAHEAWLKRKLELAHELAEIQEDPRVAKALIERYSSYTRLS